MRRWAGSEVKGTDNAQVVALIPLDPLQVCTVIYLDTQDPRKYLVLVQKSAVLFTRCYMLLTILLSFSPPRAHSLGRYRT